MTIDRFTTLRLHGIKWRVTDIRVERMQRGGGDWYASRPWRTVVRVSRQVDIDTDDEVDLELDVVLRELDAGRAVILNDDGEVVS